MHRPSGTFARILHANFPSRRREPRCHIRKRRPDPQRGVPQQCGRPGSRFQLQERTSCLAGCPAPTRAGPGRHRGDLSDRRLVSELSAEDSRGKVLTAENGFAAWLARATDYVHDNFTAALSLEEVAKVAGVRSGHLSRVFRERMGCTVGEYVRRLRFEFACQQILMTERPLCEIACEAGFADQSHFNRIFRDPNGDDAVHVQ